jgi:hypothetical protein
VCEFPARILSRGEIGVPHCWPLIENCSRVPRGDCSLTPCPCYTFVSNNSQICTVPQAELASIHSSEEQTFLISSIRNSEQYTANIFYWLGGQVAAKGGHLNWTDNTPATYTGKLENPKYNIDKKLLQKYLKLHCK